MMAMLQCCLLVFVMVVCQINSAASTIMLTPSQATGSVAEDAQVGATVITLTSSDADVTFTLESQVPDTDPNIFGLGETLGVVIVADIKHLDFEKGNEYRLVIKATKTTGSETGSTTVTVTVTDVNEAPTFAEAKYTACVNTSSNGETVVVQVTASDGDGDTLKYSITAGDGNSMFTVGGSDGTIKVATGKTVDETPASYNLTITATDDDATHKTGTTTVSINVADPCPIATSPPVNTTLPGVTQAPNFATTITASFCVFLVSGAVHLLHIW